MSRALESGIQSALHPQGPHAEGVAELTSVLVWGGAAVFALVLAFAAYALWWPRRGAWSRSTTFVVAAGLVFPLAVLSTLLVYTLAVARAIVADDEAPRLTVEVVAEQWWWRVHYLDASRGLDFASANEIVIPAGRTVEIVLKAADVIHSLWVPNLAGKIDAIPGHTNVLRLKASREGVYRGQCAEYCGGPHALMGLFVVAKSEPAFEDWRRDQRANALEPANEALARGRELFLARCAACHAVRGTAAKGALGPDLTHVGGRVSLAAATLRNDPASLAAWIAGSQHVKPGNLMPSMNVYTRDELTAVAAYLASLR